jgi:Patatin-like phospholipase
MATPERYLIQSPRRLKLLSLDGGGVKGISTLIILRAIMNGVRDSTGQNDFPLPVDYFDLAGGTSTGGLIALMLFRLRMGTMDAIRKFKEIAQQLFSPRIGLINLHDFGCPGYYLGNAVLKLQAVAFPSRFPGKPLKEDIDKVMGESIYPGDTERKGKSKLLNEESGRMWVAFVSSEQFLY